MENAATHRRSNEEPAEDSVFGQLAQLHSPAVPQTPVLPSRGMLRKEAATYCRMTPRAFSERVKAKKLPGPAFGTGRGAIWDRHEIDAAWDRRMANRSGHAATDAAHDLVRRSQEFFKHDK
jgi:hypothetical protein